MVKPIDFLERQRLLKLQKDYEADLISEDEMTLEDIEALSELYRMQIRELRKELNRRLLGKSSRKDGNGENYGTDG